MKLRFNIMFRFSSNFPPRRFPYSTLSPTTSTNRKPHSMVDYLMDSLQFSKQDAISISSKAQVTHLKSTINSDLVITIFKNYGLNLPQIRQIVSSAPKLLTYKANKTLEPKIRAFHDLGLSGSDLVNLVKKNPQIFWFGLHTRIMPGLEFLRKLVGTNEKVIEVINKSRWVYVTNSSMERISTNVLLLHQFGLLNDRIMKFFLSNPEKLMVNPKLLESTLSYVKDRLGIPCESANFIHAVSVVLWCTDSVEEKMQIFRSFGWPDSDIVLLFRKQPYCFNHSEANIRAKLKFFMWELGYTSYYLTRCSTFFTFSLDKRVIPRNMMLEILKEKKVLNDKNKLSLITVVSYSELRFLEFLRGFEDDLPSVCEIYMDSVKRVS